MVETSSVQAFQPIVLYTEGVILFFHYRGFTHFIVHCHSIVYSLFRCNLTEILFELYKVPSVAFGIDSLFSLQNHQHFNQDSLGISVILFFQKMFIILMLDSIVKYFYNSFVRNKKKSKSRKTLTQHIFFAKSIFDI